MKLLLKVLIPVLVLVGSVFAAKTILENRPEARKRPQFAKVPAVEATTLSPSNYPVVIRSQGTVRPTQSSTLVAEVTGTINELSDTFVVGGRFAKGDILVQIDERDYSIALTQAQANLAQSKAVLQEETARGQLAKSEWESLRRGQEASAFTLRLPQLAAARANRDAAQAQVDRAELDLERTRFVAPFDGHVLDSAVDQGQFVSRGARLGQIYATQSVDVRLPLSNRQMTFLSIPNSADIPTSQLPNIELSAVVGGVNQNWTGKVVRAEGVDAATQQLNIIARIEQPFAAGKSPLRIGQYVEARIAGTVLEDVFVVPRASVREDREVLIVNEDSQLERRDVVVAWTDELTAAISDGLVAGDVLVTTPLSTVTNGTPVRATVDGKAPARAEGRGEGKKQGFKGNAGAGQGQARDGKARDGKASDGKAPDGKAPDGKAPDGKARDTQAGNGQSREGQAREGQAREGQAREGQAREGQAREGQADKEARQDAGKNAAAGTISRTDNAASN